METKSGRATKKNKGKEENKLGSKGEVERERREGRAEEEEEKEAEEKEQRIGKRTTELHQYF